VDIDGDGQINYEEFTKVIIEERSTRYGDKQLTQTGDKAPK